MRDVSCLTISDIHLGHKRNKTKDIIKNLDTYFDDYSVNSQFSKVDIIFIAGDLFDRLLMFSDKDVDLIYMWLFRLMRFCLRFNIKLRLLEGTPSHDWKQSSNALSLCSLLPNLDFKYVDTLSIEYIADFDCHVLYIPDEWNASTDVTLQQVKVLLKEANLSQVDIGVFHGSFGYQLPAAAVNAPRHSETEYLNIVRHYITIGHIHVFSVFERILAQGSFDRISHNEEEPKGGILFTISESKGNSFTFIENKNAKIFRTVLLKSKDLDKSLRQIAKEISSIPDDSFVRIKATKDHPLYVAFDELKIRFPMYNFTKANIEDEADEENIVRSAVSLVKDYSPITINKDNIVNLILLEVEQKHNLEPHRFEKLKTLLIKNNA